MTERDAYADPGVTMQEAMNIVETSMDIARTFVPDEMLNDRLQQKAVHPTGNIELQHLTRCQNDPVVAGARVVLDERPVVTDVTIAKVGIIGCGHDCQVRKAIGNGAELAAETGMTWTVAAMLEPDKEGAYDSIIAVVGNASIAALALCDRIENETRPAVVVATPVGFMKVEESRKHVRDVTDEYGVPAVTNAGKRGGSGLVAVLTNELIHIANDVRNDDTDLVNHE